MTIGLKEANNYHLQLVMEFPPRPIKNDEELMATQNRVNVILNKRILQPEYREYLRVLGMLIYEYEENSEPIPKLEGVELLKALIEEDNLSPLFILLLLLRYSVFSPSSSFFISFFEEEKINI